MSPLVSVILPSFDTADSLAQTVESIRQQTVSDIEILIVDHGSTDGSKELIGDLSDSRVRPVILDSNHSVWHAVNSGIRRAKAPFIAIAQSGDEWVSSKLAMQMDLLGSDPVIGAVFSPVVRFDSEGGVIEDNVTRPDDPDGIYTIDWKSNRSRMRWTNQLLEEGNGIYHASVLVRRAVYDAVGEYDDFYRELCSLDLLLRVLQKYEIFMMREPAVRSYRVKNFSNGSDATPSGKTRESNERRLILERCFRSIGADDFAATFRSVRSPGDSRFSLPLEKILYLISRGVDDAALFRGGDDPFLFRDVGLTLLREFADRRSELSDALEAYELSSRFPHVVMGLSSPWFDRCEPFSWQEKELLARLSGESGDPYWKSPADLDQEETAGYEGPVTAGDGSSFNLAVFDDSFPCDLSAFRYQEFCMYLERVKNTHVFSTGDLFYQLETSESFPEAIEKFGAEYPDFASCVSVFDPYLRVDANLAYCVFLHLAETFLPFFEKNKLPFIFTLYPGGGFRIEDPACRDRIKSICSSEWFRGVITTQPLVTSYLLDNSLCPAEKITEVIGVVLPELFEDSGWLDKKLYGVEKTRIDICFVAHKYTPEGEDKGYDIFIECAKRLAPKHPNIVFHVIGGFVRDDIDVSQLGPCIKFHGILSSEELRDLFQSMDIILSPNRGVVRGGQFDGFPTGACVSAGLCGVAMFCTDILGQNVLLRDGTDFVLIGLDPDSICARIEEFVANPTALYWLSRNGQESLKRNFSLENQMTPRVELISSLLASKQKSTIN